MSPTTTEPTTSEPTTTPAGTSTAVSAPRVITRGEWGAAPQVCAPDVASRGLVGAVVHHTAGGNSYSTVSDAMRQIRGDQAHPLQESRDHGPRQMRRRDAVYGQDDGRALVAVTRFPDGARESSAVDGERHRDVLHLALHPPSMA